MARVRRTRTERDGRVTDSPARAPAAARPRPAGTSALFESNGAVGRFLAGQRQHASGVPALPLEDGAVARLQRDATAAGPVGAGAAAAAQTVIRAEGQPLAADVRAPFERKFGFDFGPVRLHTGAAAEATAEALNARAFTVGRHIAFGPGELQPHSAEGQRLLAHELAHVVQQSVEDRPLVARWKIAGDKATVETDADTLWALASRITGSGFDWPCIWPIKMQSPKAWEVDYQNELWVGDEFDISNLTAKQGTSGSFVFPVANDNLQGPKIFYNATDTLDLETSIEALANEGATPIQSLVVAGTHTHGDRVWGDRAGFSPTGLNPEEPKPSGAGAHNKSGPRRCWFTRNATARIAGCSSETVAGPFAAVFLRRGAQALGTNHWICWWHLTQPADERFAAADPPACNWPPVSPRMHSAADYNGAAGLWVTFKGKL